MSVKEIDNERLKEVQELLRGTLNIKSVERREELMKYDPNYLENLVKLFREEENVKEK